MPKEVLEISVDEAEHPTIKIAGEVDFHNAGAIRDVVSGLLRQEKYSLVLDLAGLEFIDSSGLSALLDAAKVALSKGGGIRLQSPGSQLIHVLTIAGFAQYFSITPRDGRRHPGAKAPKTGVRSAWQVTQFEIPPRTELIAEIRGKVAGFAGTLPFSKQDLEDIKLAVGEAVSNAVRYGCPHSTDNISVRCAHDGETLHVQVKDNGPCFDVDSIEPPTIADLDEGGRGIYFMRILMDEVRYFFSGEGTTVELVKRV